MAEGPQAAAFLNPLANAVVAAALPRASTVLGSATKWLEGPRLIYAHGTPSRLGLSCRQAVASFYTKNAMTDPASILIVDDEPNILLSLQFVMKKAGYAVRTASNGEEALAEIARAKPSVVLLDVMMPKLDGFTVCERIRATSSWQDVRIIMLTARGRDAEREKGLALGADDYITKPFSTRDATDRVAAVLAKPKNTPNP